MNYKEIIESRYNRDAWQQLLHDIFLSKVVFRAPYEVKVNSHFAKEALKLGTITLSDEQQLAIYEVELSDKVDIERNKRGIRDMLTADWRRMGLCWCLHVLLSQERERVAFLLCQRNMGIQQKRRL